MGKRQRPKNGFRPPIERLDARQLLAQLQRERTELAALERRAVAQLRAKGVPWREIAALAGLNSAQAAHARYAPKKHPPTKPTTAQS
jgi:hypothetical protein